MTGSGLAPGVEAAIEHLRGLTHEDFLAGRVAAPEPQPAPVPRVSATDLTVGDARELRVRRYVSDGQPGAPSSAVVWAHGGGWVGGDIDMPEADAVARRMCAALGAIVFSVDYGLAPNATYPAAMNDVIAAFDAATGDPEVAPNRIVLGGASAGGNLAAGAAQALRDRDGPQPACVFLAYPATDPAGGPYERARPEACPPLIWFDQATTSFLFSVYLGGAHPHPYAVPAAGDLGGLPPTLLATSSIDALEEQGIRYVDLLTAADVVAEHHRVDDMLHGYLNLVGTVPAADGHLARHLEWIAQQIEP